MKQKSIINDTFEKHKKLVLEHLNEKRRVPTRVDTTFDTTVDIDPKKLGKNLPEQTEVNVEVYAEGEYADASFDHEFGTHDPGSGYDITKIIVTAKEDTYVFDAEGNQTSEILFNAGDIIDQKSIVSNIDDEIYEKLAGAGSNY